MRFHVITLLALTFTAMANASPQHLAIDPKDQPVLDAFLVHAKADADAMTAEKLKEITTPETFCWIQLPKLNASLTAFELTGNAQHLNDFVKAFGGLRSLMVKGPDGLQGWYGKPIPSLVDPAKPDVKEKHPSGRGKTTPRPASSEVPSSDGVDPCASIQSKTYCSKDAINPAAAHRPQRSHR